MFLKLKASIYKRDLLPYLLEQKKRFSSNLSKITWHVKSSCDESGASAIGLVIVTFFIFLLILLPLNLFVQELNLYRLINQQVQVATEMSCFDAILHLDAVAMSEEKLVVDDHLIEWFVGDINKRLKTSSELDIIIENIEVSLLTDRQPNRLFVKFEYEYDTHFILKGYLSKLVGLELSYELPLNN